MKNATDLAERIPGTYWHAAAILKVELDPIIRVPLEELRFEIGGGAITRRVDAEVGPLGTGPASLHVPLKWKAAEHPNLFPVMDAELRISDAAGNHVELRLVGEYRPPLGAVGALGDALAGVAWPRSRSMVSSPRSRGGSRRSSSSTQPEPASNRKEADAGAAVNKTSLTSARGDVEDDEYRRRSEDVRR